MLPVTKPFVLIDVLYSLGGLTDHSQISYHKANNTFLNSLRKSDVEAQVEFTLRVIKRGIEVLVKKDSLLVYVLKFFRNFGG